MEKMMKTGQVICMILVLIVASIGSVSAEALKIMTSEEPPLNFTDEQGELTGFSMDIAREIQRRVGNSDHINIYPWARVYNTALKEPNVVAFTMARTEEREDKFQWITLVSRNAWVLFARKGSGISVSSLDDAKTVKSIGVIRDGVHEQLLRSYGFQNLEPVTGWEQNLRKLMVGRVSLIFYAVAGAVKTCRTIGVDFEKELETVYAVKTPGAYIVMSQKTSLSTVEKWQQAAQQMKEDGTFDRIMQKWIGYLYTHDGLETHLKDGGLNLWKEK